MLRLRVDQRRPARVRRRASPPTAPPASPGRAASSWRAAACRSCMQAEQVAAHLQHEHRRGQRQADPEPAGQVRRARIGSGRRPSTVTGSRRHAADRAGAGADLADLAGAWGRCRSRPLRDSARRYLASSSPGVRSTSKVARACARIRITVRFPRRRSRRSPAARQNDSAKRLDDLRRRTKGYRRAPRFAKKKRPTTAARAVRGLSRRSVPPSTNACLKVADGRSREPVIAGALDDLTAYFAQGSRSPRRRSAWAPSTRSSSSASKDHAPVPYEATERHQGAAGRPDPLRLDAGDGGRERHRPGARQGQRQPGAGRPVRAVGRAAGDRPRHLRRRPAST